MTSPVPIKPFGLAIALVLVTIWAPRPGERPTGSDQLAMYRRLPPLGMITPKRRYRPPYKVKYRGSGRRKMVRSLG